MEIGKEDDSKEILKGSDDGVTLRNTGFLFTVHRPIF
jgi:hypothetical protein